MKTGGAARAAGSGLKLTIGGTIEGGLFLGVGQGTHTVGTAMIVAFLLAGAVVSVVARFLVEMALAAGAAPHLCAPPG